MIRRLLTVLIVAGLTLSQLSGIAAADHLVVEVAGPEEATVGEELEITATVREASGGEPVEGASVAFFANAFFAGVTGEIRLGSATTNGIGVATFTTSFSVRGIHRVRVDLEDDPGSEPGAVIISVGIGSQIVASEAGVEIPGFGSWLVTFVIGAVWAIMIAAAVWVVRLSRPDEEDETDGEPSAEAVDVDSDWSFEEAVRADLPKRQRRRFNLAPIVAGVMASLALGIVALLIRSPNTHHNFDPEGYGRSPVAYLDAAYLYPGPGLADGSGLTGNAVGDGQALFLKLGCAGCHGLDAQGAASAPSPAFATRSWLGTVVRTGLPGGMPAYSDADLPDEELDAVHAFLLVARDTLADETPEGDGPAAPATTTTTTPVASDGDEQPAPSFADVTQILQPNCSGCHGAAGGWSAADYDSVISSGDNAPAVIPGDAAGSVLAQKLLGTHTFGNAMPPSGSLADSDIQMIVDWIEAGAAP